MKNIEKMLFSLGTLDFYIADNGESKDPNFEETEKSEQNFGVAVSFLVN